MSLPRYLGAPIEHTMQTVRHFLLSLQYFTRIPITGRLAEWAGYHPAQLPKALAHLPGVGLLLGLCSAAVLCLALWLLPPLSQASAVAMVAALLATACTLLLTGAFHEDGLADLADGLGGAYQPARALEIMKDSRIGAFGAITMVMALLGKITLIAACLQILEAGETTHSLARASALLIAGQVFSRLAPLLITAYLPHVGDTAQSKSKPIATQFPARAWWVVGSWLLLTLLLLYWLAPSMAWGWGLLAALAGGAVIAWRLHVRLHGFTGDGLGAAQQIGELFFYLAMLGSLAGLAGVAP